MVNHHAKPPFRGNMFTFLQASSRRVANPSQAENASGILGGVVLIQEICYIISWRAGTFQGKNCTFCYPSVTHRIHVINYIYLHFTIQSVHLPPGARVRPPTNYWVSYQPTIGHLTNQLLGILPTNYWVFYQPTIGYLTNQLTTFLLSMFPPPWQPMFSFRV